MKSWILGACGANPLGFVKRPVYVTVSGYGDDADSRHHHQLNFPLSTYFPSGITVHIHNYSIPFLRLMFSSLQKVPFVIARLSVMRDEFQHE